MEKEWKFAQMELAAGINSKASLMNISFLLKLIKKFVEVFTRQKQKQIIKHFCKNTG